MVEKVCSRRHLAFLLWPDSTEAQARTNLRRELHHLRHALPGADQFLAVGTQTVQWRADGPYTLDINDFERALAQADEAEQAGQLATLCTMLAQAVEVYAGDLLPSCYDEWIVSDREWLRQQYIGAMERLTQLLEEQTNYRAAIQVAERLLRHDSVMRPYINVSRACMSSMATVPMRCGSITSAWRRSSANWPWSQARKRARSMSGGWKSRLRPLPPPGGRPLGAAPVVAGARLVARRVAEAAERLVHGAPGLNPLGAHFGGGGDQQDTFGRGTPHLGRPACHLHSQNPFLCRRRPPGPPVVEWLRSDAVQATRLPWVTFGCAKWHACCRKYSRSGWTCRILAPLTESWQRLRYFEGLARAVLLGSQPLMLLIDDLQWCDQETLEWLRYLLHFAQAQRQGRERLLIVGTARREVVGPDHPLMTLLLDLRHTEQLTEIELRFCRYAPP